MDSDINVPVDEGDVYLKFRAGRMFIEGTKVVPDTRKGLIRLNLGEDRLFRFQWLDRTRNVIEHNEIMFPDEATFEKVDQSSGRVYILKYKTDDRKYFFWMQEPNSDGDRQLMLTVNLYINTAMGGSKSARNPYPSLEDIDDDILSRDGNLVVPALVGEASSDVPSTSGPVKLEDLQRILSNIGHEVDAEDPDEGLGLGDILKPDLILPLIETLSVEESFASYLPEGHWSAEEFIDLLQSPPFRQQVDSFTYVLRTGQIDLTQFGIDPSKYKFTVMSFLEALEDSVSTASASSNSNELMDESQ